MESYIVDTNFFLRFLLKDDLKQYKEVERLFKKAKKGKAKIIVAQIVLFEISFILGNYYKLSRVDIIEKLDSLLNTPYLVVEEKRCFINSLKIYESSSLSFVDCFLIAKALEEGKKLMTFDKKLEQAYRELIEH